MIRRRDFLTVAATLAAFGGLAKASGLSGSISPQVGGGIGLGFDGGLGGAGKPPTNNGVVLLADGTSKLLQTDGTSKVIKAQP